jgi:hypothetical protein
MREEFDPKNLEEPVRTVQLNVSGKPSQLAISTAGIIAVSVTDEDTNQEKIYIFDSQYNRLKCINVIERARYDVSFAMQLCFDYTTGSLFAGYANVSDSDSDSDEEGYRIQSVSPDVIGVYRFNVNGKSLPAPNVGEVLKDGVVKLSTTTGIACNGRGDMFFSVAYGDHSPVLSICKVAKKSNEVSLFHSWDCEANGYDSDNSLDLDLHFQMCVGPNGNLYSSHGRGIDVLDEKGNHQTTIGSDIMDFSESIESAICLIASRDGRLFVSQNNDTFHVLSLDGSVLGVSTSPDGGLYTSLAIDNSGYLHVLEPLESRVSIF